VNKVFGVADDGVGMLVETSQLPPPIGDRHDPKEATQRQPGPR
jgi:hypothetical protein